jgi:hypothetical protein
MTRSKSNCSKKPLLTTGIWTRDLWFRSLDLRPLDQPAVKTLYTLRGRVWVRGLCNVACVVQETSSDAWSGVGSPARDPWAPAADAVADPWAPLAHLPHAANDNVSTHAPDTVPYHYVIHMEV